MPTRKDINRHTMPRKLKGQDSYSFKGKDKIKYNDSLNRYYSRRSVKFSTYDLHEYGVMPAKPATDYSREIGARSSAPYLIGVEIELENRESRVEDLANALNTFIPGDHFVCDDGSLRHFGYEIVIAPRSLTEVMQAYHRYYGLLNTLASKGFSAHDNGRCGLHIHISRKALSADKWKKLISFIMRNKSVYMKLSRRIGTEHLTGRSDFYFCQFQNSRYERYCAINTTRSDTVEFRFFRGTLKPSTFFASLETIFSLVEFFRQDLKSYGLKRYVKFLNSSKFKYASKYMHDMCPNIQLERKNYTAEERQERKRLRQERQNARLAQLDRELRDLVSYAQARTHAPYIGTFAPINRNQDQIPVVVRNVPVVLSSDFRRDLFAHANAQMPTVRLAFFPETLSEDQIQNLHVYIGRSRGWGRDNRWINVRTNRR